MRESFSSVIIVVMDSGRADGGAINHVLCVDGWIQFILHYYVKGPCQSTGGGVLVCILYSCQGCGGATTLARVWRLLATVHPKW